MSTTTQTFSHYIELTMHMMTVFIGLTVSTLVPILLAHTRKNSSYPNFLYSELDIVESTIA